MMLSNPDSYSALMTTFEELDQLQNNYEQCFGKPSHYGPNAESAVLGFQTAIAEVKKLLLNENENDMSDDAEFMQKLAEAQQKPMIDPADCYDKTDIVYINEHDRATLYKAEMVLVKMTEAMKADNCKELYYIAKDKGRVNLKPEEWSVGNIGNIAKALYKIEKLRKEKFLDGE